MSGCDQKVAAASSHAIVLFGGDTSVLRAVFGRFRRVAGLLVEIDQCLSNVLVPWVRRGALPRNNFGCFQKLSLGLLGLAVSKNPFTHKRLRSRRPVASAKIEQFFFGVPQRCSCGFKIPSLELSFTEKNQAVADTLTLRLGLSAKGDRRF